MKESDIEGQVNEYANRTGVLHLKLNVTGRRGWPDDIYLYRKEVLFIEFKRPGEQPTEIQKFIHTALRQHGFRVEIVTSPNQGKDLLRAHFQLA